MILQNHLLQSLLLYRYRNLLLLISLFVFGSWSGFDYNPLIISPLPLSTQNKLNSSGLDMTTAPSTVNTMAVATLIQWPQVRRRKTPSVTQNILQASLEGLEGASQPRAVTTLEEQPRHTTTHMQASTVRQGPLTGRICQIYAVPTHSLENSILSKFN